MPLAKLKNEQLKQDLPDFSAGDIVRVHQRITEVNVKGEEKSRIQVFEGLVIGKRRGNGSDAMFTVRKISSGIGVERIFPLHSPNIVKLEITKASQVRKAKLYYVRQRQDNAPRIRKGRSK